MKKKKKPIRSPLFRCLKGFLKIFIRKPKVVNLNEDKELEESAIYLSNHVGATVPLKLELYFPHNFKFWGTHEMVFTYKERWQYLAHIYFKNKKHKSTFGSKVLATLVCPFMSMFYRGMKLIPTYTDGRSLGTIKFSTDFLNEGNSVIIFPENSSDGYHDVLTQYFAGFVLLAKNVFKKFGKNVKIYNMYYKKKGNTLIIDKYVTIKDILAKNKDIHEVAEHFKNRANELREILCKKLSKTKKADV